MKRNDLKSSARAGNVLNENCVSRAIYEHVAGKWGGLILTVLLQAEKLRFAELRDQIGGISEKMLAQTLKHLERDGLVTRKSYDEIPPKVEYALTATGKQIAIRIKAVCEIIEKEAVTIQKTQQRFDSNPPRATWQQPRTSSLQEKTLAS